MMGAKGKLLDFLARIPEFDTVEKRKALVAFTGFTDIGLYLDWEGSNMAFCSNLVEELGRRGQATMVGFLAALPEAPQVSVDRKDQIAALEQAIQALDPEGWRSEFGVGMAPVPTPAAVDIDMLAMTVVSSLLANHFRLAGGALEQTASQAAARLDQLFAGDPSGATIWNLFKQNPDAVEVALVPLVKDKLRGNPGLAQDLANLTIAGIQQSPGIDVFTDIRVVKGDVVGAIIGNDVIQGIRAQVTTQVDTVETGATLVGAVIGSPGAHVGPKTEVNTGGGVYVGGNVTTGGGDFVGRDKITTGGDYVAGDKIGGDKITVGNISSSSGIAIGRGAQAKVSSGLSADQIDRLFAPVMQAVSTMPPEVRDKAFQNVAQLREEVAKGKGADDRRMAKLIDGLVGLVPGAVSGILSAFGSPLMAGIAGPVTSFVLERLGL